MPTARLVFLSDDSRGALRRLEPSGEENVRVYDAKGGRSYIRRLRGRVLAFRAAPVHLPARENARAIARRTAESNEEQGNESEWHTWAE